MKTKLMGAGLGLLMLGAAALPAEAGDWNGGYRSGAAAVPVPAPMPIPIYKPQWYFRFDAGIGLDGDRDGSESGMTWGTTNGPPPLVPGPTPGDARGSQSSWFNGDFDTFLNYGAGVGYYWSDRVRMDLTVERLADGDVRIEGVDSYEYFSGTPYTGNAPTQVNVYVDDTTKVDTVLAMLNAYYDFGRTAYGLTPYIGGGIGIAVHYLNRRHSSGDTFCTATTPGTCDFGTESGLFPTARTSKQTDFSLAAALTAGLTYSLSDVTVLDFNYRYLYVGGTEISMAVTDPSGNASRSTVSVGELSDHQLRAGLRFNIH